MPKLFAIRSFSPIFYTLFTKAGRYDKIVIGNGYTLEDDITWVHFPRLGALKYLSSFLSDYEKRSIRMESYIERTIFKSSKKLWAVSNLVKKSLIEDYNISEDKIFVLYNGVNVEKYHPLHDQERIELRKKLNMPEDARVIIFVGNNPIRKGFQRILHALKRLEEAEKKNYTLLAIGFKPNSNMMKLSSDLRIRFLGNVSEEKLIMYYQASDFLLLPSYFDPFPLVVLEAMVCGVIPIVTPTVGSSEIIINEENGFIVKDQFELLEILKRIGSFNLDDLRENVITTAKKYSWNNIARSLISRIDRFNE